MIITLASGWLQPLEWCNKTTVLSLFVSSSSLSIIGADISIVFEYHHRLTSSSRCYDNSRPSQFECGRDKPGWIEANFTTFPSERRSNRWITRHLDWTSRNSRLSGRGTRQDGRGKERASVFVMNVDSLAQVILAAIPLLLWSLSSTATSVDVYFIKSKHKHRFQGEIISRIVGPSRGQPQNYG